MIDTLPAVIPVSGTAVSDNTSNGAGSGDYYMISVEVTAGKEKKEFKYIAPQGEKLNKTFSVSLQVPPGATSGSFDIKLLEINARYGEFGWHVRGSLSGVAKTDSNKPAPAGKKEEPRPKRQV